MNDGGLCDNQEPRDYKLGYFLDSPKVDVEICR
jgi:hypothetical protein